MTVETTAIHGLLAIGVRAVDEPRGTVRELFRTSAYRDAGVPVPRQWEQINLTWTRAGALRGLHGENADKLIGVASGTAFGVYLDARPGSPTRGQVVTQNLAVGIQIFVPSGVCNGFQATSADGCEYLYCFGTEWTPGMAGVAVNPLDPQLAIDWPIRPDPQDPALVSAKDATAPAFAEVPER